MISSIVSRLVILLFGTLYPAYASYKAVRTKNVKEYVKWMMYWIVFALFTCAETFTDVFFSFWFPFYYEIKIILVLWLLSPATKGSSILYRRFVHPALCKRESEIDEALARATEQGYSAVLQLGSKGVNYATTVLMQTAIKGGGGLVQHLKKSYSLSDLTGENEDLNKNTQSHDEVDHDDSQRREKTGCKGFSPRRTQSINNEMDMYFPEVNVEMQKSTSKESLASLTNIKSSEDISSGYSSAEALHLQSNRGLVSSGNRLERTTSVGARVRSKPRSSIKKIPEGEESFERQLSADILSQLSPEQARELIAYLSKNREQAENDSFQELQDSSESDDDSSTLKADAPDQSQDNKKFDPESVASAEIKELTKDDKSDGSKVVDSCSDKMDELKKLLNDTKATVGSLISSQEDINLSRNTSECIERAGKYRKKPAPKVPVNDEDEPEARPVKATLVIKPGRVKNFSNNKDFLAFQRRKQMIAKTATKDSLTKFLTIPKSIFNNTFHKEKDDDSRSISSGRFRSRSGSCETIKFNIDDALKDLADAPISSMNDNEICNNSKLDHLSEPSSTVTQRSKSESTDV
ncbi:nucleolar and coiled-body phosphoprotein 1-like isoform X2 [Trichogramma pretiosum]|uniref:nucleolar and coiled-body phosphoprotein 1-like isoform X2 n=1 Tax=Trichogramma pretiosum TaxID=7493 RepID=UPI0006C94DBB|nr:nucleolar and coiled-body phosphoprotein 1-like isoform X2 [Trichogramma pretiosum]